MQSFYMPEGDNATSFNSGKEGLMMADTINGLNQKNARMWQLIALVSLLSFFIALGIIIYTIHLPETVPVIVTVAPDGEARYVGKVEKSQYGSNSIPETAKVYVIKKLISLMHTWVMDREAQRGYIEESMAIVQGGAVIQLDSFYRTHNPFTSFGEKTRSTAIEPPLKQSEKTYVVYFVTTEKNRNGYEGKKYKWSALITLDAFETSPANPLGIYITNFDIKLIEEL